MPIFFDQHFNVNNAVKKGFALRVDVTTLSEDKLQTAIIEMMTNPKHTEGVNENSDKADFSYAVLHRK